MKLSAKLQRLHILEHSHFHGYAGSPSTAARAQATRSRPPSTRLDDGHRGRASPSAGGAVAGLNLGVGQDVGLDVDLLHDEEDHRIGDGAQRDHGDESSWPVCAAPHLDQQSPSTDTSRTTCPAATFKFFFFPAATFKFFFFFFFFFLRMSEGNSEKMQGETP